MQWSTTHLTTGAHSKNQEALPLEIGSGPESRQLHDHLQQHIRALKVSVDYNVHVETYLTAAIELKLDENTKLRWAEHSSKCEKTPLCQQLLESLDIQARHHESVAHSVRSAPKHKATPKATYMAGSDNQCVACNKETHPLNNCGKFLGMSRDERWELLKANGYCMIWYDIVMWYDIVSGQVASQTSSWPQDQGHKTIVMPSGRFSSDLNKPSCSSCDVAKTKWPASFDACSSCDVAKTMATRPWSCHWGTCRLIWTNLLAQIVMVSWQKWGPCVWRSLVNNTSSLVHHCS